jgi:hypothetical protein
MSKRETIAESLQSFIRDQSAFDEAIPGTDPLYADPEIRTLARLTRSAETRSGKIIERAIIEKLLGSAEYTVLAPTTYPVTQEPVRQLDVSDISLCLSGLHLSVTENLEGTTEIDFIAISQRTRTATVYEVRRANGRLGYRASRNTLLKLARMALRDWVKCELGFWVDETPAFIIMYCQISGAAIDPLPRVMVLTKDDLDGHFNLPMRALVEAATASRGRHVDATMARIVQAIDRKAKAPDGGSAK